jgi:hypothetical protein
MGYGNSANQQGEEFIKHNAHQLACQAPPVDGTTGKLIEPIKPIYRDSFSPIEAIWVPVDINFFGEQKKHVRLYVIHRTTGDLIDETELIDVSGGYEEYVITPESKGLIYIKVWEIPIVHPNGYDVIVDFPPLGKYDKGKDIIDGIPKKDAITQRGFVVPEQWVCLESISFNHTPNCNYFDAIDVRHNENIDIAPPEWEKGNNTLPAVYIKNRSIKIKAVFSASTNLDTVEIGAFRCLGRLGNVIKNEKVKFEESDGIKKYRTGEALFQVYLPTPCEITSFYQEWEWYFKSESSDKIQFIGNSRNKIFVILAQPQSPWKTEGDFKPWTELLNLVCVWAKDETTPEGAAEEITHHLCNQENWIYQINPSYTESLKDGDFFLRRFLTKFLKKTRNFKVCNCADMGKAMVTFANVVGCGSSYRYCLKFGSARNCLRKCGKDEWQCVERGNTYHAFGSIGDKIFDAAYTHGSATSDKAKAPYFAQVMANIPWEDYKRLMVKEGPVSYPETFKFDINVKR